MMLPRLVRECGFIFVSAAMLGCGSPSAPPSASSEGGTPAVATPAPSPGLARPVDAQAIAERVVSQSAGIKSGDIVRITGGPRDLELLESMAVHVRKVGGHPFVTLNTDRMAKRMYTDVPAAQDSEVPAAEMRLAQMVTAVIAVDSNESEDVLADIDPKRVAATSTAGLPVNALLLKNNVKFVEVGNAFYPTPWRAQRYGMSLDELRTMFWDGVNVDYKALQQRGTDVAAVLAAGNEVHITSPSGTDLRVRRQGRSIYVSSGTISSEDIQKGGANVRAYLPAGEVATTVVPGTASGKVVVPVQYFRGQEIQNLVLTFSGGNLTSMAGSGPGFDRFKASYDAASGGKEILGFIDFGINPNIRLGSSSRLATWVPAGTVTIGTGDNTWAGGDNNAAGGVTSFLSGCTVTLDGKVIVENGQLKI